MEGPAVLRHRDGWKPGRSRRRKHLIWGHEMLHSEYGHCKVPTGISQDSKGTSWRALWGCSRGDGGITVGSRCWITAGLLLRVGNVPKDWHRHPLKCDFILVREMGKVCPRTQGESQGGSGGQKGSQPWSRLRGCQSVASLWGGQLPMEDRRGAWEGITAL